MAELVHATAIAYCGRAALIRGRSGSGKTDLALRCLALAPSPLLPEQALLISDDQVLIEERPGGALWASAPETIKGKLEVRGLGIIDVSSASPGAPVALIVDLVAASDIERLPEEGATVPLLGHEVRRLKLSPFEASAPIKLLLALRSGAPG